MLNLIEGLRFILFANLDFRMKKVMSVFFKHGKQESVYICCYYF